MRILLSAFLLLVCLLANAGNARRIVVIDPGHAHAAGMQGHHLEGVSDTVLVFAPEGPELREHLALVESYNKRKNNPTHWVEKVYAGKDFLSRIPKARPGDFVILAGKNSRKTDYMLKSVRKGYSVLSDKPMAINSRCYRKLCKAYRLADRKGLIIFDEMTQRYNGLNIVTREILSNPSLTGKILSYDIFDVHHYYKKSAVGVILRPAWYFDVREQGEGIADISTHNVDLAMWQCSPERPVTKDRISEIRGSHFPTVISREQFAAVSGEKDFPRFLKRYVRNGNLEVNCNGILNFKIDDIPVSLDIEWRYGDDSTKDIFVQTIKCEKLAIMIGQDKRMMLEAEPEIAEALESAIGYIRLKPTEDGKYMVRMESTPVREFSSATDAFTKYLGGRSLPDWENVNTLTKYYITTTAVSRLR